MERPGNKDNSSLESLVAREKILSGAWELAQSAHAKQKRDEGTPYFTHLVAVARIIYEDWGVKSPAILAAALLHDSVEDSEYTHLTLGDIKGRFGEEIAFLVDGVSKFRSVQKDGSSGDRETIKKVFDKTLIDPRVAVLKLADRLHNMRTLQFVSQGRQIPKAEETLDVYVPLAESLGMWKVKSELEDLAMKFITPEDYSFYKNLLDRDKRLEDLFQTSMVSRLESLIKEAGVPAWVEIRVNSLARLKHKMERAANFASINDVLSLRVVVNDSGGEDAARDDCYKMEGRIKNTFCREENSGRFDDFFAHPKDNGYSALQITLDYPIGAIEVAVATKTKEEFNNWGIVSLMRRGEENLKDYVLKVIFTPTGKVKFFPKEATGIDLAYSIDPMMGMRATKLLIDGKPYAVSQDLPNGALVEVVLGKARNAPPEEYLNYCLPQTRKIIENQIAEKARRDLIKKGKDISETMLAKYGYRNLEEILAHDNEYTQKLVNALYIHGFKGHLNNLYLPLGSGELKEEYLEAFIKRIFRANSSSEIPD